MLTFDENFTRMKKIFKIALLCAALVGALACFTSCSKDSLAINKLVGKWQVETMTLGGLPISIAEMEGVALYLTFHRDGTYLLEMIDKEDRKVSTGTWEYADGVLKTIVEGVETLATVSELKISRLVITAEILTEGEPLTTTITLKKVLK